LWDGGNSGASNANGVTKSRWPGRSGGASTDTYGSSTFPIGAFVGRIGDGPYFFVGTDFRNAAQTSDDQSLLYWDSCYDDNYGSVMATVSVTPTPIPASFILLAAGACPAFLH